MALADDDEVAEAVYDNTTVPTTPPLSEWTAEVATLHLLSNQIAQLIAVTVAAHSGTPYRAPRPLQAPETAFARARRKAEQSAYDDLMHKLGKG